MLQSMGSQELDTAERLNWTEPCIIYSCSYFQLFWKCFPGCLAKCFTAEHWKIEASAAPPHNRVLPNNWFLISDHICNLLHSFLFLEFQSFSNFCPLQMMFIKMVFMKYLTFFLLYANFPYPVRTQISQHSWDCLTTAVFYHLCLLLYFPNTREIDTH